MATVRLDTLPKELIAHIACCADALSVLNLSRVCHSIRASSYDVQVFKHLIVASQRERWNFESLDIDAIILRAGVDSTTWARYALADQRAWNLVLSAAAWQPAKGRDCHPLMKPADFINYMPELFVVKHPLMHAQSWNQVRDPLPDRKPTQLFGLAMAILALKHGMPNAFWQMRKHEGGRPADDSTKGFLWALCVIANTVKIGLRARAVVWPYNNAASRPHIAAPTASQIPLHPLSDGYNIPAPFSRRAIELLGRSTSAFGSWDSWYRLHNDAAFSSVDYFTKGSWCGYYIHYGAPPSLLEPPMTDIQFQVSTCVRQDGSAEGGEALNILATDCVDGIDGFNISGTVTRLDDGIKLSARKSYHRHPAWEWDCRLTPFGIVGRWGDIERPQGRFRGIVWLWKKEWTETVQ